MKTLVLHIGMHKTGTSSIQDTLHANRELLLAHDINYMALQPNHTVPMSVMFMDDVFGLHPRLKHRLQTEHRLKVFQEKKTRQIINFLKSNESSVFVISGESMSAFPHKSVESLREFMLPYFDDIIIVGYVRPPKSFMISSTQQHIKGQGDTLENIFADTPSPDYRDRFENYLEVFGGRQVQLKLYHKSSFPRGCVVASFLEAVGAEPELYDQLLVRHTNQSLSLSQVKILSAINTLLPEDDYLTRNDDDLAGVDHDRFTLPESLLSAVVDQCQEDIRWMERILGVSLSEYDVMGADNSSYLELTTAEREIVQQVVSRRKPRASSPRPTETSSPGSGTLKPFLTVVRDVIYRLKSQRSRHH